MKISPAIVLFFLSPAIAELLSGSAPPSEFFNPIIFILLSSLYGSGAIIARELKIRWNKTFVSLFFLGTAYAIIEEALMVKSFFDPNWIDIGFLGVYGRWIGVNWIWSLWLTIYHAIYSIAIPITLVELVYPHKRNQKWISNKKLVTLIFLLAGITSFGYLFLTSYRPPLPQYLSFIALTGFLVLIAWKLAIKKEKTQKILTQRKAVLAGFLIGSSLFFFFGAGPHLINQPILVFLLGLGYLYLIYKFIKRYTWNRQTQYQKFSLITGALLFLIFLTPFQEFDINRPDNTQGMIFIGIISLLLLLLFRKKLKNKSIDSLKKNE